MPCDAPISIDFNIQTTKKQPQPIATYASAPIEISYGSYTFKLKQYSGPRNPQANVIDLNFSRFKESANG